MNIIGAEQACILRTPRRTGPNSYMCKCGRWNEWKNEKCYCGNVKWEGFVRPTTAKVQIEELDVKEQLVRNFKGLGVPASPSRVAGVPSYADASDPLRGPYTR
jgi:hypothetical protein